MDKRGVLREQISLVAMAAGVAVTVLAALAGWAWVARKRQV